MTSLPEKERCPYQKETGECVNLIAWANSKGQHDSNNCCPHHGHTKKDYFERTIILDPHNCAIPIITFLAGLIVDEENP